MVSGGSERARSWMCTFFLLGALIPSAVLGAEHPMARPQQVSGTLEPEGPPRNRSTVEVAGTCVVDLVQDYVLSGSLEGKMQIDFRIFVAGPCGSPPGTYDEYWIAHGSYSATIQGGDARGGGLLYLANVLAGGEVAGTLVLGDGLNGELNVTGTFERGALRYQGEIVADATGASAP